MSQPAARRLRPVTALMAAAVALVAGQAGASDCAPRTGVGYGETAQSIAQRCGINVERLQAANPGMISTEPQVGTFVQAPHPAIPTPVPTFGGNRGVTGVQQTLQAPILVPVH